MTSWIKHCLCSQSGEAALVAQHEAHNVIFILETQGVALQRSLHCKAADKKNCIAVRAGLQFLVPSPYVSCCVPF